MLYEDFEQTGIQPEWTYCPECCRPVIVFEDCVVECTAFGFTQEIVGVEHECW